MDRDQVHTPESTHMDPHVAKAAAVKTDTEEVFTTTNYTEASSYDDAVEWDAIEWDAIEWDTATR